MIKDRNLILEKEIFSRSYIEKRMELGGFNSLSKFELFIWDLEIFLQIQKRLGDKIILKGGAATQFYIPISAQRTSIDIDMICLASRDEVNKAIIDIESELVKEDEYFKFRLHKPRNPKLGLDDLDTYFMTVPSICSEKELFSTNGKQEVKIEFIFSGNTYSINRVSNVNLFALESDREFNILSFEDLFADKLTTLGPNTIGVSDERADEQIKQIYDVITLMITNIDHLIGGKALIRSNYEKVAKMECKLHQIPYEKEELLTDMKILVNRLKNIENENSLLHIANNFQSNYLRKSVNRDKAEWTIVGYQLDLLINFIFGEDYKIVSFEEINNFIETLKFKDIRGPESGKLKQEARDKLEGNFGGHPDLSSGIFKKRVDRIVWELVSYFDIQELKELFK